LSGGHLWPGRSVLLAYSSTRTVHTPATSQPPTWGEPSRPCTTAFGSLRPSGVGWSGFCGSRSPRERHRAEAAEFLGRRLRQLANEREKLLRAYYADAIDVATLKREQPRINAEVAEAESQLANDGEKLAQAKQIIDLALDPAKDCATSYRKASPEVRKLWNQAFFHTIRVQGGKIVCFTYEEPFASLLSSHKVSMVEVGRRYSNQLDGLRRLLTRLE
jgi:hypothetical protein